MSHEQERKRQIQFEITRLENKLKTVKKLKHKKDLERQIKERQYNLDLGIFKKNNLYE